MYVDTWREQVLVIPSVGVRLHGWPQNARTNNIALKCREMFAWHFHSVWKKRKWYCLHFPFIKS